jgi:hypothetical protein
MPVLVVTGAAGTGKSTVCAGLAGLDGLLALDGDVLARGAAAVADGRGDYDAFWSYLLQIARDVHSNGLIPVFACVCLPDQVLGSAEMSRVAAVHFLVLGCQESDLRRRIQTRVGATAAAARVDFHLDLNRRLQTASVAAPNTLDRHDTTSETPEQTVGAARAWVTVHLPALAESHRP